MRKTELEYQVWGRNQYGKDHLCTETTRREAKERVKEYRENELGGSFWFKAVRAPLPGSTFKVRFDLVSHDNSVKRLETETVYTDSDQAKTYADQLNEKSYLSAKNARVVIIAPSKK